MLIDEAESKFIEFLKKKDLKYTDQRRVILQEVFRVNDHFSAEEFLDLTKKHDSTISKATLYRTLSLLADSDILETHDFGDGKKSYEVSLGVKHHDHMVCMNCKKIIEFESDLIEKHQETIAKKYGFKIMSHSHKLFGKCQECLASNK